FIYYPYTKDSAIRENNAWKWELEVCTSGQATAHDTGNGWQLCTVDTSFAETGNNLQDFYNLNGTSGAAGPSMTTHLDFALSAGAASVSAGVSETSQGQNSYFHGADPKGLANANKYSNTEVSTWWDSQG